MQAPEIWSVISDSAPGLVFAAKNCPLIAFWLILETKIREITRTSRYFARKMD